MSRYAHGLSSRVSPPPVGSTCTRTSSGSEASSRANRCRRAISNATCATSHGRRGTVSGRSIRPTCSTKISLDPTPLEQEDHLGTAPHPLPDRNGVDDPTVHIVLPRDLHRREQPRHGRRG